MPADYLPSRGPSPQARRLVRWCQERGILVVAYGSLGGAAAARADAGGAAAVARRHGVSSARVLLRWAVQQGVAVIPGATSAAHIEDNLQASAAPTLSAEDVAEIERGAAPRAFKRWRGLCDEAAPVGEGGCEPTV